jgi:di/tricarboxylate transporter
VIILIGGGFALARGISSSGLSLYLAQKLQVLQQVRDPSPPAGDLGRNAVALT